MNMAGMNPVAAGGPVGGGMMMMNNGSPATQPNSNLTADNLKKQLNAYIYEYFLKSGHWDIARMLVKEQGFEFRTKAPVKQSPGRRKDGEVNGVDSDAMDMDLKDDIPDDLPRPDPESSASGSGFLFEWFSIFFDLYFAHRNAGKMQGGNLGPAAQYLMQHQNMQRMRENQQNQNMGRPGMMNPGQYAMRANMRNGMVNGQMARTDMSKTMTPQQMQQMQAKQAQMIQQQQQMRQEQGEVDMNGRPGTPAEGENGGSPSKRPRLEGQQFNNGMMPNGRPGMPGVAPQGMMIQNAFNPNMNQAQFRQNGGMPPKAMQPGMANGMMNMANAGSPMMQGINPAQFGDGMAIDMYNAGRMGGQPMQGGPGGAQSGNHALQDYQMQLMLLEQQNKKRLMMARQEQDSAVNRDGAPMPVGMSGPMSPSGSRSGTSPNPTEQMKRTPQIGGLPGSPAAGENMQGRSPAAMGFINGMPAADFNPAMFMKENQGMMGPGNPNMRPPTSMDVNAMARQQGRMGGPFPGGQPMAQQPSQGGPQPMGTPGQRNEMPPPQAPANNKQPSSPPSNAPPTPSQTNKANPKGKKAKEDNSNKKRPVKKSSTANAPNADNEPPATPTPSTPITPQHPASFNPSGGKVAAPNVQNANAPQVPNAGMPPSQPQMQQPEPFVDYTTGPDGFNLDFSTLDNADVLENFDFDSFLNTSTDDQFNFDGGIGVGADFDLNPGGE